MGSKWYVLHTKPKKENQVYGYVRHLGLEVFYPTLTVKPVNPRSSRIRPIFPRYMFIHADLEQVGVSALQYIPFAIGLVQFGGEPAPVPENIIHELRLRTKALNDAARNPTGGLQPGDPVRITQGPLAGYAALFDMRINGTERVQLLLQLLGREVRVQVEAHAVEKLRRNGQLRLR